MDYQKTVKGIFESRPNRFIARVYIDEKIETVHVKNTGRCKELLIKGADVILSVSDNPERKTKYDLIAVYKKGFGLINIDSQAPNTVAYEWLKKQDYDFIKPEFVYGDSRIDFYMEKDGQKYLMEVKGCTLERDGVGFFPDAPTERGIKHLRELQKAVEEGYEAMLCFVIQMDGIKEVRPNTEMQPEFATELEAARCSGVNILYKQCHIREDGFDIVN